MPPRARDDTPQSHPAQPARALPEVLPAGGLEEKVKGPEKLRVLVVGDQPASRGVTAEALRTDGHDPTEVACAEEALEVFDAHPFPLVIADVDGGRMGGLQLLREIKQRVPETLVVIITSQALPGAADAGLREGAYDILVKPFVDPIRISAVVDRACQKLRLEADNRSLTHQLETYASELERVKNISKDDSERDALTGLFNRRHLRAALDREISRAMRHQRVFSLAILDVDLFKRFNETYGTAAGDEVLRGLAKILRSVGRTEHLCARYGGEEFLVLIPEANRDAALIAAERMRRAVEGHRFEGPGAESVSVTVSIGVASFPEDGPDGEALLGLAQAALDLAKEKGRNRVQS